jgi:hypothetical protein
MLPKMFLHFAVLLVACGTASAGILSVSASGQFSSSDFASQFVEPDGLFSLSFNIDSSPVPVDGTVTSLGFDVPFTNFYYTLNNMPVIVNPSEIRFNSIDNGGLFDVVFGTGLGATIFDFQGVQAFSETTASPAFSEGTYEISSWTVSDPIGNYDYQTPISQSASIAAAPEPSSTLLILCGLTVLAAVKFRTFGRAR